MALVWSPWVGDELWVQAMMIASWVSKRRLSSQMVSDGVDWSRVVRDVEEVHCVGRALFGKGRSAEGGQDFEDGVVH